MALRSGALVPFRFDMFFNANMLIQKANKFLTNRISIL